MFTSLFFCKYAQYMVHEPHTNERNYLNTNVEWYVGCELIEKSIEKYTMRIWSIDNDSTLN